MGVVTALVMGEVVTEAVLVVVTFGDDSDTDANSVW